MKKLEHTTFIIPLRIDSEERQTNLDAVLDFLCRYPGIKVLLLEADAAPRYKPDISHSGITYRFVEDHDPVFYRTRYLNLMLRHVQTPVAGVWDSDVIVPMEQVAEAVEYCLFGTTLCYPYDGRFYAVFQQISKQFKETGDLNILVANESKHRLMHGRYSVGGAFVVNVESYLLAGGENEHFYGWGPEDTERRERIYNLGLKVNYVDGCLYHLYHPRGKNSNFANKETAISSRREYMQICRMYQPELEAYIATWPWVNQ